MIRRKVRLLYGLVLVGALLLSACDSGDGEKNTPPEVSATPTITPEPYVTLPPTWTSSPPPTDAPTHTPIPTFTPRPTQTPTPEYTPGAYGAGDFVRVVTSEEDINAAVEAIFSGGDHGTLTGAPIVTLVRGRQLAITMQFHNDFLDRSSDVTTLVRIDVSDSALGVSELIEDRIVTGALVSDESILDALVLVETGLNNALNLRAAGQTATARLVDVQALPNGVLEVIFTANSPTPG